MPLQYFLGSAASVFAVTASGGPVAGGTTPQPTITFAVSGTGGPVVGETVDQPTIGFTVTASGGPIVGGMADQPSGAFTVTGSGGPVVGEHAAQPFLSFFPPMTGGVLVASHSNGAADYPVIATGGPVVGSTFSPTTSVTIAGSGGPVVGGAVSQPGAVVTITGSGGVLITQHLQPPQPPAVFFVTGSGGVMVGSASPGLHVGGYYHVYENHGNGDAVDYDFPVETTAITSWTTGSLPFPGDYSFHVRAFYGSPFLEEHNLDARVRVVLDAAGIDVTSRPAPPIGLAAQPIKGGQVRLSWLYKTPGGRAQPSKFNVYAGTPGVSYASHVMQIAYGSDGRYFAVVTGLTSGSLYQFVVRAANATAEEPNTNIVSATPDSAGPNPPQFLVAVSI